MRKTILIFSCCASFALAAMAQRTEALLEKNWKFTKGDVPEATQTNFDDSKWETVTIPHDWAIFGPFDRNNDLQEVAVTQDLEKQASVKTGRTGGLPYVGVGWYRTAFDAPADKQVTLVFDGAMSEARVYVNGKEACFWPFGYNSFHCDVTGLLNADGKDNVLAVRVDHSRYCRFTLVYGVGHLSRCMARWLLPIHYIAQMGCGLACRFADRQASRRCGRCRGGEAQGNFRQTGTEGFTVRYCRKAGGTTPCACYRWKEGIAKQSLDLKVSKPHTLESG